MFYRFSRTVSGFVNISGNTKLVFGHLSTYIKNLAISFSKNIFREQLKLLLIYQIILKVHFNIRSSIRMKLLVFNLYLFVFLFLSKHLSRTISTFLYLLDYT